VGVIGFIARVAVGFFTGALAASLGAGGGIVFVPALVVLFGFSQHLAQGTSLAVIFPTAIVSTIVHARAGRVRWELAIPVAVLGVLGALGGATLALRLDADLLRRLFGTLLIVMSVRMFFRAKKVYGLPTASPADGYVEPPGVQEID